MTNAVQVPQRRKALASVRKGVLETPVRILVYGVEGIGKSTFAAGAPRPIFLGSENGTERLDVERLQPSTWTEAVSWVDDLAAEKHEYQTLVIDPINWLEPLCFEDVTGVSNETIDTVFGGYGKGYTAALDRWRVLLSSVERCWKRGMHVVLTAHCQVKNFANPEGPAYDRYEIAMHAKAAGLLKQWCDAVLFARLETFTKIDPATKKAKGYSSGARLVHTQPCAAYDAKTRWKLPEELPLSWEDFFGAVQAETHRSGELATRIARLVDELGDPETKAKVLSFVEKNRNNADRLAEAVNRLNAKLEEKRTEKGEVAS